MVQDPERLGDDELVRIYDRRIRSSLLDGVPSSDTPTAIVVAGQPGSGTRCAIARVQAQIAASAGPCVVLTANELREYHPVWRHKPNSTRPDTAADIEKWTSRLIGDATSQRVNLLLESDLRDPNRALALTRQFKASGYQVTTVAVATDRDQSRQASITAYALTKSNGISPDPTLASLHDASYDALRQVVARVESELVPDRIQLVTRDGRQLYANHLEGDRWVRESRAAHVLDDFRERQLTARELADSVLRWDMLVARLVSDDTASTDVARQAIHWRNDAAARAQSDPDAAHLVTLGREAQAFSSMNRYDFLRQFPQHADTVQRMHEAVTFAEANFPDPLDRQRFMAQTRGRLAERIAEGRANPPVRSKDKEKTRAPKTR
ncbi:Toxin PezT [Geobacteraceae bacterium]|nr:Toxin PezT [Geobacteraceae bacterium]